MAILHEFALFAQEKQGPIWKGASGDLAKAKEQAQRFADRDGCEYFIFSLRDFTEVARAFPKSGRKRKAG